MRSAEEMDQADVELRETILKVWPFTAKEKIELLVPTTRGEFSLLSVYALQLLISRHEKPKTKYFSHRHWQGQADGGQDLRRPANPGELEGIQVRQHASAKGKKSIGTFSVRLSSP